LKPIRAQFSSRSANRQRKETPQPVSPLAFPPDRLALAVVPMPLPELLMRQTLPACVGSRFYQS